MSAVVEFQSLLPAKREEREPPYNLEAEQALLGALLFDNEAFYRMGDQLKAEHFYDPVHQRLFDIATRLIRSGHLAEPIVIKDRLADDAAFAEVGGVQYLAFLVSAAPPMAHAPEFSKLIYDLALRRELIRIGGEMAVDAANRDTVAEAQDVIEATERKLYALAESGQANAGFQSFAEALAENRTLADLDLRGNAVSMAGLLAFRWLSFILVL